MDTGYTMYTYMALALGVGLAGLIAVFLELHAQAQPVSSWWYDCRRSIQLAGRTLTGLSVGAFALGAVMLWSNV